jgi:hypothetical protein
MLLFTPVEEVEPPQVFFNGVIAYALRCAFLHNGDGEVAKQRIIKNQEDQNVSLDIKKVKFLANPTNLAIELEQTDSTVLLNPKIFAKPLLEGINKWIIDNEYNNKVLNNTDKLISFE